MDKLQMQSKNLVDENIDFIAKRFPNCVTEAMDENGKLTKLVDFDLLKQELSKDIVEGNDERYTLNWAGKKQAILTANSPINATLRPVINDEEVATGKDSTGNPYKSTGSVGKDGTPNKFDSQNLYIESDNFDALKLLRKTYLRKIKMIYIDPPYNTGHDFVYKDNFATSSEDYLRASKSYDEQGNRMFQNTDSNGRFHSDWLSMMYSRLRLAKDLLTDDGAIFISIDDNERGNLEKLCSEVFGDNNFVGEIVRKTKSMTGDDGCGFNLQHESLYIYAKNKEHLILVGDDKDYSAYSNPDNDKNGDWCSADPSAKSGGETTYFGIENPYTKKVDYPPLGRYWAFSKSTLQEYIKNGKIKFKEQHKDTERGFVFKRYKKDASSLKNPLNSLFADSNEFMNQKATTELTKLFNASYFSYPKPVGFIQYLVKSLTKEDDTILDFFSGSATTAHAVMQLNAEDGGNRKFIMIQLPEKYDEKSEAFSAGYENICEMGKERIRKAGSKIIEDLKLYGKERKIDGKTLLSSGSGGNYSHAEYKDNLTGEITAESKLLNNEKDVYKWNPELLDIGFRVLKLDDSCMKDVYYNPHDLKQDLLSQLEDNLKDDRTAEDLLFQVMLDMGVLLSTKITERKIEDKTIFIVDNDPDFEEPNLICCFEKNLTDSVVGEIAKLKPRYAVFRDSSMSSDSVAVNFDQIFETYSKDTTRKII